MCSQVFYGEMPFQCFREKVFLVDDGREELNITKSGATIGPQARPLLDDGKTLNTG